MDETSQDDMFVSTGYYFQEDSLGRKRRRRADEWEKLIENGTYILKPYPKDRNIIHVVENGVIIGCKCRNCPAYFLGNRPGGNFYKHIRECAMTAEIAPTVKDDQKQKFQDVLQKFMVANMIPNYLFETETFYETCQTLLNIGFESRSSKHYTTPPKFEELMPQLTTDFNGLPVLNSSAVSPASAPVILEPTFENLKQEPFHQLDYPVSEISGTFDSPSFLSVNTTSKSLPSSIKDSGILQTDYKLDGDILTINNLEYFDARKQKETFLCRNCLGFGKMTEAKMRSIMKLDSPHCFQCRQHNPKSTNITEFDLNDCQKSNDSIFFNELEFADPHHKNQVYYCVGCLPSSKVTKITKKIAIKVTSDHCRECYDMRSNVTELETNSVEKSVSG